MSYPVGSLLDLDRLESIANFGYGGSVDELATIGAYRRLKSELQNAGVRVHESSMGIIGGTYTGRRTLSAGCCGARSMAEWHLPRSRE